jgi:DNA topoisomerase-3
LKESELIGLMEKHGIGTDASMATHIQNISDRNYVRVDGRSRALVPTPLGISLVKGYLDIDKNLVEPALRGRIENSCNDIALGKEKFETVVEQMVNIFREKFNNFKKNISKMDFYFQKGFSTFEHDLKTTAKTWTLCGVCKRYMNLMQDYSKIVCPTCDETFALPKRHIYQKTQNNEFCHLDGFQIFYYIREDVKKDNVHFKICPKCYDSKIDDEEGTTNQACFTCEVKECAHSAATNFLMDCKECNSGQMVILSKSNQDQLAVCNNRKCQTAIKIGEKVKNIKVLEFDEKLQYHKLKVCLC